jgi:hypothetical protein
MLLTRNFIASTLIIGVVLSGCATSDDELTSGETPLMGSENASDSATRTYDVTIENLTTGQPLSPGVMVTHTRAASLFQVGSNASLGIRKIAEDGDNSVALSSLASVDGVFDVEAIAAPIHRIGGPGATSLTVRITARADANLLSFASMLICSNDGFTGVSGTRLPSGFQPMTFDVGAYDSGTEANDELSTSIVDPCFAIGPVAGAADGNARTATSSPITIHNNVNGTIGQLTAAHRWTGAIARVTVQRVK